MSKNNIKNIGLLLHGLSGGGTERVASILSKKLSEDFNIIIIVYSLQEKQYESKGNIINLNVNTSNRSKSIKAKLKFMLSSRKKLISIKKNYNLDMVISFGTYSNILNILSGFDKKIISTRNLMSDRIRMPYSLFLKGSLNHMYKKADAIVPCSKRVEEDLINHFNLNKEKIKVIYNPYLISKIENRASEPLKEKHNRIFDNPVIINVGSLTKQKGQSHLIKAFSNVKKSVPEANLVILGEGGLKSKLKSLAKNLGIADDVHFLGYQENPFKFIKRSTAFALSSLYEGFPNVVVESLACGTPVISTDCPGGSREILAPKTSIKTTINNIERGEFGILTPPFTNLKTDLTERERIFSKALQDLIKKKDMNMHYSKVSIKRAKMFKASKVAQQWIELINKI